MKSKELRIWNYIQHNGINQYVIGIESCNIPTDNIFSDCTHYDTIRTNVSGQESIFISQIKPISITEEILLKCGFDKCLNGFWDKKEVFNVKLYDNEIEVYLTGSDTNLANYEFKYLHQLQNLYFALIGEELNITL